MKLAIVGSRTFDDFGLLDKTLCAHFNWGDRELGMRDDEYAYIVIEAIISGGALGADGLAKRWAFLNKQDVEYFEFLPDWESDGKAAGFIRNKLIVDACDMVLAFWDGKSKGTEHTIKLARQAKKPTFVVYF